MFGELFWYGLGGFFALLGIFFLILFFFKPLIQTYLSKTQGWFLFGFVVFGILGYFIAGIFIIPFCITTSLKLLCSYLIRFIFSVCFLVLFWVITKPKKREF